MTTARKQNLKDLGNAPRNGGLQLILYMESKEAGYKESIGGRFRGFHIGEVQDS